MVSPCLNINTRHWKVYSQRWGKNQIVKTFTLNSHVATMEANALIPLFTFTLDVENNYNVKNDANLAKPILTLMKHCLQPSFITSNEPRS